MSADPVLAMQNQQTGQPIDFIDDVIVTVR